jgi:hypothetical protein
MAKEMTARFPGQCIRTGRDIRPGDRILFHGRGRSVLLSRSSSGAPAPVSDTYTFSSGHTAYRNVNGRCEDAPCCGCCTI